MIPGATCRGRWRSAPLAVIAVYFGINLLYLFVFSITELAALKGSVLDVVADRLLGSGAGHVMGLVSIVSLHGRQQRDDLRRAARLFRDGPRRRVLRMRPSKVHPTYRTPAFAIVAQTIWTSLLILTGSGNALLTYTGFSITLFLGVAVFALFVLRRREPNAPRPFKAIGYPVAPAIFTIACFVILANALYNDLVKPLMAGHRDRPVGMGLPGDRPRLAGLLLLRATEIGQRPGVPKVSNRLGSEPLWNSGRDLRPRPEILPQRDRASRLHVHIHLEILEARHADFDLVPALFEPELLERAVEVVHEPGVVAVDEDLRIAWPDA